MEIVINEWHGGFELSKKAVEEYAKLKAIDGTFDDMSIKRDDPVLIQVVKSLGAEANGMAANLKVVEIPKDVDWVIESCDGKEWISEKHRTWR